MPTGIASDGNDIFGPVERAFPVRRGDAEWNHLGICNRQRKHPAQARWWQGMIPRRARFTRALALLRPSCCAPFVAVANFNDGLIHTFTSSFELLAGPGSFHDPNLPAGYAPYGMQAIGNQLFVTYALQDAAKRDPVSRGWKRRRRCFRYAGKFHTTICNGWHAECPVGRDARQREFRPIQRRDFDRQFWRWNDQRFRCGDGKFPRPDQGRRRQRHRNPGIRGLAFRDGRSHGPEHSFLHGRNRKWAGWIVRGNYNGFGQHDERIDPCDATQPQAPWSLPLWTRARQSGYPSGTCVDC